MRSRDSILTLAGAAIALVVPAPSLIRSLAQVDFQKELVSNQQIQAADRAARDEMLRKIKELTTQRCRLLRKKLLLSSAWIFIAMAAGLVCVWIAHGRVWPLVRLPSPPGLASVLCFSVATLGRLGWEGQSYKGDTVFEQLDTAIFWALYGFGAAFGAAAFLG